MEDEKYQLLQDKMGELLNLPKAEFLERKAEALKITKQLYEKSEEEGFMTEQELYNYLRD